MHLAQDAKLFWKVVLFVSATCCSEILFVYFCCSATSSFRHTFVKHFFGESEVIWWNVLQHTWHYLTFVFRGRANYHPSSSICSNTCTVCDYFLSPNLKQHVVFLHVRPQNTPGVARQHRAHKSHVWWLWNCKFSCHRRTTKATQIKLFCFIQSELNEKKKKWYLLCFLFGLCCCCIEDLICSLVLWLHSILDSFMKVTGLKSAAHAFAAPQLSVRSTFNRSPGYTIWEMGKDILLSFMISLFFSPFLSFSLFEMCCLAQRWCR